MIKYGGKGRGAARIAKAPYLVTPGDDQVWGPGVWFSRLIGRGYARLFRQATRMAGVWRRKRRVVTWK